MLLNIFLINYLSPSEFLLHNKILILCNGSYGHALICTELSILLNGSSTVAFKEKVISIFIMIKKQWFRLLPNIFLINYLF